MVCFTRVCVTYQGQLVIELKNPNLRCAHFPPPPAPLSAARRNSRAARSTHHDCIVVMPMHSSFSLCQQYGPYRVALAHARSLWLRFVAGCCTHAATLSAKEGVCATTLLHRHQTCKQLVNARMN
jgi:hypothetical protein